MFEFPCLNFESEGFDQASVRIFFSELKKLLHSSTFIWKPN